MVAYVDFSPTINKVICFANSYLSTSFFLLWRFWWLLWKELYLSTINSQNCCNLIVGLHVGITTDLDYWPYPVLRNKSIAGTLNKKLVKYQWHGVLFKRRVSVPLFLLQFLNSFFLILLFIVERWRKYCWLSCRNFLKKKTSFFPI